MERESAYEVLMEAGGAHETTRYAHVGQLAIIRDEPKDFDPAGGLDCCDCSIEKGAVRDLQERVVTSDRKVARDRAAAAPPAGSWLEEYND